MVWPKFCNTGYRQYIHKPTLILHQNDVDNGSMLEMEVWPFLPDKSTPTLCLQPLTIALMQLISLKKRLWLSAVPAIQSATVL